MSFIDERGDLRVARVVKWAVGSVALVIILLTLGCGSFYTVEQGERGVHTRTGALVAIKPPGLHGKIPFMDAVQKIEIREQPIEWKYDAAAQINTRMESYSRDQQPADISVTVTWALPGDETTIAEIFTTYGSRERLYRAVVLPKAVEAVKNVFGTYDAVTVIQQRGKFNLDVSNALKTLLQGYPVEISGVQVQDISFSDAYENAVEARMMAQVEVQKREQQKQTEQINADIAVIKAKAEAEQVTLDGEARAKVTRMSGDAEAAAIRARADALASNNKLVELTLAEKWDGSLPTTMVPGQSVPFITVR